MEERATIILNIHKSGLREDLDIPLDITANEFIHALNSAYNLGIDISDMKNCYLKAENPLVLLKGSKMLREFGLRNGSIINVD